MSSRTYKSLIFQDLSRLYNEVVENFRSLETEIHRFKEFFVEETHGIPVLEDCVKHLITRVGKLSICGILKVLRIVVFT